MIFTSNKAPSSLYKTVKEDNFIKEFKNFFKKNYYLLKNETNQDYRLSNRLGNHFFFFTESQNELKQNNLVKQITKNSALKYHNIESGLNLKFRIILLLVLSLIRNIGPLSLTQILLVGIR